VEATGLPCPQATGLQSPQATGHLAPQATGLQSPLNNKTLNNNIKQQQGPLIEEIIQRKYAQPAINLDAVVVALLKELGLGVDDCPNVANMPVNRVQALYDKARGPKIEDPVGWFVAAVDKNYQLGGKGAAKMFERTCDLVRQNATHLQSKKTGDEYEINKFKTGPVLEIFTPGRGKETKRFTTEKELGKFLQIKNN